MDLSDRKKTCHPLELTFNGDPLHRLKNEQIPDLNSMNEHSFPPLVTSLNQASFKTKLRYFITHYQRPRLKVPTWRGKLISLQGFVPLTVPRRLREGSLSPTFGNMPRWERQAPIRRRYGLQQAANCLSMCAMCVNVLHLPVYLAAFRPTLGVGLLNMFSPNFYYYLFYCDVQVIGTVQYLVSPLL